MYTLTFGKKKSSFQLECKMLFSFKFQGPGRRSQGAPRFLSGSLFAPSRCLGTIFFLTQMIAKKIRASQLCRKNNYYYT